MRLFLSFKNKKFNPSVDPPLHWYEQEKQVYGDNGHPDNMDRS